MKYPLLIHQENESAFGVTVPDIPGCFSAGDTLDEALENAAEAIDSHLSILFDGGEAIPQARPVSNYGTEAREEGAILAVVEVDMSKFLGQSQKINITLPQYLINRIDEAVARNQDYKSRSGFFQRTALKELGL